MSDINILLNALRETTHQMFQSDYDEMDACINEQYEEIELLKTKVDRRDRVLEKVCDILTNKAMICPYDAGLWESEHNRCIKMCTDISKEGMKSCWTQYLMENEK